MTHLTGLRPLRFRRFVRSIGCAMNPTALADLLCYSTEPHQPTGFRVVSQTSRLSVSKAQSLKVCLQNRIVPDSFQTLRTQPKARYKAQTSSLLECNRKEYQTMRHQA